MIAFLWNWTQIIQWLHNNTVRPELKLSLLWHLLISLPDLCYFLVQEEHPWLFSQPVLRQSYGSIFFPAPHLSRPQLQCYSQGKVWNYCDIRNSGLYITNQFHRCDNENRDTVLHKSLEPCHLTPTSTPRKQWTSCTYTPSLWARQIPYFCDCLDITQ